MKNRIFTITAILCMVAMFSISASSVYASSQNAITKLWVSETGINNALIGWKSAKTFDHVIIEYGILGFKAGTGVVTTTNMNPFELSGLNENSVYHCYITEVYKDGSQSKQAGPIVIETLSRSFTFDAGIAAVERYTKIPLMQASFYPTAKVSNHGTNDMTDIKVMFNVKDMSGASVYTDSATIFTLKSGNSVDVFSNSAFIASSAGLYSIDYSIISADDINNDNNTTTGRTFEITTNTYARDDDDISNGLGIAGPGTIYQGSEFEIVNVDEMISVDINFTGGQAGDSIQLKVYAVTANQPGNLVAESIVQILSSAGTGITNIPLSSPTTLNPGKYIVGLLHHANGTNISLNYSDAIYSMNESWMQIDGGIWEHPESAGYEATYIIRPVFRYCSAVTTNPVATNASCFGEIDASIDITPAGGIAPYSYYWSNGATTEDINSIPAGPYLLTITDAIGCQTFMNLIQITQPTEVLDNASVLQQSSQGANDGQIDLNVTGGTPPYTYLWNDGAMTEDRINLGPGTYCVDIVDAINCHKSVCYDISSLSTGLSDIASENDFRITPNPTSAIAEISFREITSSNIKLEVLDILGNVLFQKDYTTSMKENIQINLSSFADGIYLIRAQTNNKLLTKRLILEK